MGVRGGVVTLFCSIFLAFTISGKDNPQPSQPLYQRCKQYLEGKDTLCSEKELLEACRQDPIPAEACFLLGVLYVQRGEHGNAQNFLLKALSLRPDSVATLNNLGVNALEEGDDSQAERYFRKVLAYDPQEVTALYNLGLIELKQKRFADAAQTLGKAAKQRPKDVPTLKLLLAAEIETHDADRVQKTASQILQLAPPDQPTFYFRLADTLENKGFYEGAVTVLRRAQALWPQSAQVDYRLALVSFNGGKIDAARQIAESAIKKENRAELHNLLGKIYETVHLYKLSVEEFQTAVRLDPEDEGSYFDLGYEFLQHDNFGLAEKVFITGTNRLPRGIKLRLGLAAAYFGQTKYEMAIKAMRGAIGVAPESPLGYFFLARALDLLRDYPDLFAGNWIREDLKRYIALEPRNPFPYYACALSLLLRTAQGNRAEAMELLTKATELDPRFAVAHLELGNIYFENKEYQQAIGEYSKALQGTSLFRRSEAYFRLGQAYARTGNAERAREASALAMKDQKELQAAIVQYEKGILRFLYTLRDSENYREGNAPEQGDAPAGAPR